MKKFEQTTSVIPVSRKEFRKQIIAVGGTKKDADQAYRDSKKQETHVNDMYLVQIDRNAEHGFGPKNCPGGMFELTVRRLDRAPMHDWRHVQQIKNMIVGKENEMVELYPAESRLRDSANQYWFYGFNDPKMCFPFGMMGRFVDNGNDFGVSKQRRLDDE